MEPSTFPLRFHHAVCRIRGKEGERGRDPRWQSAPIGAMTRENASTRRTVSNFMYDIVIPNENGISIIICAVNISILHTFWVTDKTVCFGYLCSCVSQLFQLIYLASYNTRVSNRLRLFVSIIVSETLHSRSSYTINLFRIFILLFISSLLFVIARLCLSVRIERDSTAMRKKKF